MNYAKQNRSIYASVLFASISLLSCLALAERLPTLFAKTREVVLVNPKTGAVIATINRNKFDDLFELNDRGEKYERGQNQKPYPLGVRSNFLVGFYYNNQVVGISMDQLSYSNIKMGVRTPKTSRSKDQLAKDFNKLKYENDVLAKIHEFHDKVCDSTRGERAESMDRELKALEVEWDVFIKSQTTAADRDAAVKASVVDHVTRTVFYETHIMGTLDGKTDPKECKNPEDCPNSSCERDVVMLTIKNRAESKCCENKKFHTTGLKADKCSYGCEFVGDYQGVATKPNQYSIWKPEETSKFMATCFMRSDLASGNYLNMEPDDAKMYRDRVLTYRQAVDSVIKVLSHENPEDLFIYEEQDPGQHLSIRDFKHYYHPLSMPGCNPDTFNKMYSVDLGYAEKKSKSGIDYALLIGKKIIFDEKFPGSFKVQVMNSREEKEAALANNEENISYKFLNFEQSTHWSIDSSQASKVETRNQCRPLGLTVCEAPPKRNQKHVAPFWAIPTTEYKPKHPTITCRTPSNTTSKLGGFCDTRMQPISGAGNN